MSSKNQIRKERKRKRHKQKKLNTKLKKRLFGQLFMAPCCYCKSVFLFTELTVEHVVPLCLGGSNEPSNIALACSPCNHERGKEAWLHKQQINKKYYEQHYSRDRKQDRQGSLQESVTPSLHRQGEGV